MGKTIYQKLADVQQRFVAPKDQYNQFGGYSYRNFESMLDSLKPILYEYGLVLTTTNHLQECGGHVYVQSTCTLTDIETGESVSSDSYAREDETRKGVTGAQITGGCVSYASKYSLGLLLSIGTGQKDADSMDNRPQAQNNRPAQPQTRPTPPPQPAPYQPPVQQAQMQAPPMQYTAPPMQYQPPMPPQQTAPQYQAPMPPQQPVTAPPVQQAPPMAQQPPMQTPPQPPVQAPPQSQFSADGVKPQAGIPADAPTTQFTRKQRPARPADGSVPVAPHLTPSALPASWGINESSASADENEPQMAENTGWMSVPDGIDEGELPFA